MGAGGRKVQLDKMMPQIEDQSHRVTVLSQFRQVLDLLEEYLNVKVRKGSMLQVWGKSC
jgi:SNF2 family DNA or RNA helicase